MTCRRITLCTAIHVRARAIVMQCLKSAASKKAHTPGTVRGVATRSRDRSQHPAHSLAGLAPARAQCPNGLHGVCASGLGTARLVYFRNVSTQAPALAPLANPTETQPPGRDAQTSVSQEKGALDIEEELIQLLNIEQAKPVRGAVTYRGQRFLDEKVLGVEKEADLRGRAARLAAILELACQVLTRDVGSARQGFVNYDQPTETEASRQARLLSGRSDDKAIGLDSGPSRGNHIPPSMDPGDFEPSASSPPATNRFVQNRLSDSCALGIANAIADLAPLLTTVTNKNGPNVIGPTFLHDLDEVSRHIFVQAMTSTASPLTRTGGSLARTGSQLNRLKQWPEQSRGQGVVVEDYPAKLLRFTAIKGYEAVLTLLLIRQQLTVQPEASMEALTGILSSLEAAMIRCHVVYKNIRERNETRRRSLLKQLHDPAQELFSLWLRLKYVASISGGVDGPQEASLDETMIPRLPRVLGLLPGISHEVRRGRIWQRCKDLLKTSNARGVSEQELQRDIDTTAFMTYVKNFEVQGLSHSWSGLASNLEEFLHGNELQAFAALWDDTVSLLARGRRREEKPHTEKSATPTDTERKFASKATRSAYISACLMALAKNVGLPILQGNSLPVSELSEKMVDTYGPPHSSEICQALLLLREKGLLNQDVVRRSTLPEQAISIGQTVRAYWINLSVQGVQKELPLYQEYMRILGHYDDFNGQVDTWEEMRIDRGCEDQHRAICAKIKEPFQYPPTYLYNHFIDVLLHNRSRAANSQKLALSMFNHLLDPTNPSKPNLTTMNIMVRHHCMKGDMPSVMGVLAQIDKLGLKADVVTYTTVIQSYLDAGRRADAYRILDAMDAEGVRRNQFLWSKIIAETARSGVAEDLREAEKAMGEMQKEGFQPNVVTWTGLIGGYFRGGLAKQAVARLEQMTSTGIKLNTVTCNMILRSCMNIGFRDPEQKSPLDPRTAFEILAMMRKNGARPDEDTWYLLLHGFVMHEMMEEASWVVKEMDNNGFVASKDGAVGRALKRVAWWRKAQNRN